MKKPFLLTGIIGREDVYNKNRRKVQVGDKVFESVTAAARSIGKEPSHIARALKAGKLKDGTRVIYYTAT